MSTIDQPDNDRFLRITPELAIPREEFGFRTSRSSGPGGQHVNKTETRVELLFDVENSPSLTEEQRLRLRAELAPWLDSAGLLHLVADTSRSQYRNREEVIARFISLLQQALRPRKTRKRTRTPRSVHEARLEAKRRTSAIKHLRRSGRDADDGGR